MPRAVSRASMPHMERLWRVPAAVSDAVVSGDRFAVLPPDEDVGESPAAPPESQDHVADPRQMAIRVPS